MASGHKKAKRGLCMYYYWLLPITLLRVCNTIENEEVSKGLLHPKKYSGYHACLSYIKERSRSKSCAQRSGAFILT